MQQTDAAQWHRSPRLSDDELEAIDQNPHYVRSVTDIGEHNEIIAQTDIYAANGMKLLAKGARVDRSKWEHLSAHKLSLPLDLLLAAADTVDIVALARDLDHLVEGDALLAAFVARSGDPSGWKAVLGRLHLPPPVAFRLTVMRGDRRTLYDHSLRVALITCCIGRRRRFTEERLEHLFLAALCHDLGELHTDPAVLDPGHAIGMNERRFIYVHPITGFVVLQQMKSIPADVMQAVLQHHERLDGSGYPHAETGSKIGPLARAVAVAETLEAVIRKLGSDRVEVVLRFSQGKLDADGVAALRELLPPAVADSTLDAMMSQSDSRIARLANLLHAWPSLRAGLDESTYASSLAFVSDRMNAVQSLAFQAGLAPELLEFLDIGGTDATIMHELHSALDEMSHMLDDLAYEIERRVAPESPAHAAGEPILALLRPA